MYMGKYSLAVDCRPIEPYEDVKGPRQEAELSMVNVVDLICSDIPPHRCRHAYEGPTTACR